MKPIYCQPYWSDWYQTNLAAINSHKPGQKIYEAIVLRLWTSDRTRPGSLRDGKFMKWSPQLPWYASKAQLSTMVQRVAIPMSLGTDIRVQVKWLKSVQQRMVEDRKKGCKDRTPESMLETLESLRLRAGLYICRARLPEAYQVANETGLNIAQRCERSSSEGRKSVPGTLELWSCQSGETS